MTSWLNNWEVFEPSPFPETKNINLLSKNQLGGFFLKRLDFFKISSRNSNGIIKTWIMWFLHTRSPLTSIHIFLSSSFLILLLWDYFVMSSVFAIFEIPWLFNNVFPCMWSCVSSVAATNWSTPENSWLGATPCYSWNLNPFLHTSCFTPQVSHQFASLAAVFRSSNRTIPLTSVFPPSIRLPHAFFLPLLPVGY